MKTSEGECHERKGQRGTPHQPSRIAMASELKHTRGDGVTKTKDHHHHALENRREITRHPWFSREANHGHWDQSFNEPKPKGSGGC